ncbi:MAG: THUMP domain-containing class I SAM-dependent RNA methyltransferase [Desulfuromonadales bacterium]
MDNRRIANFYIIVAPGLEHACATELAALGIPPLEIETGGIACAGRLRDLYLANLWLRTASRILVRFAECRSRDFPDLHRKAQRMPWGRFIRPETPAAFRVTCHNSRLNHTTRIAETLESALNRSLGRTTNPIGREPQLVMVRIVDDVVTISIDSSGELLHRRGYRKSVTAAPLRETLAAGVLTLLDWTGHEPLVDPMCGSGSFLIEAALLARHYPPGLNRSFACMAWPGYRPGLWALLGNEAQRGLVASEETISGYDTDSAAVAIARDNCKRSGNSELVSIERLSLAEQPVHDGRGLVVLNPPYGKRLRLDGDPNRCYREIGRHLGRAYPGWRIAMLCPDPALVKATGLPLQQLAELSNGGLSVGLYTAEPAI